jgi:hypothetical protein
MIAVHPQFITDQTGKKQAAVIPIAECKALMDALEDLEDVRAYDDAKAADEESLLAEQVFAMIEAERVAILHM